MNRREFLVGKIDFNHIKPALSIDQAKVLQIQQRRLNNPVLFSRIDRFRAGAERATPAAFYFAKNQHAGFVGDNIDFAGLFPPVSLKNPISSFQ